MQTSFSGLEFATKKKQSRRERFLDEIDVFVPWNELMAVIAPFYPKSGGPREDARDAKTVLHFQYYLEVHGLTRGLFAAIKDHLAAKGLLLKEGTIVDATIIAAPCSTKNATWTSPVSVESHSLVLSAGPERGFE